MSSLCRRVIQSEGQQGDESDVAGPTADGGMNGKRSGESPRESEPQSRTLLDMIPCGIQECDATGVITLSNPAHSKMHGYDEGELVGKEIFELLDDESEQDELRRHLAFLVSDQPSPVSYVTMNRTKDGGAIDVQVDWTYKRNEAGNVIGFVSVITDITKRKQAHDAPPESNDQLQDQVKQRSTESKDANKRLEKDLAERNWRTRIYQEAPVGLCCFDTQLRYLDISEWLAALNGLSVEKHIGRSVRELFPGLAAGIEPQLRQVIETGEPILEGSVFAETPAQPGVGRHFRHNYHAVRSDDGSIVGVSCAITETTELERAEEALREALDEQEHRVEQRTLQLQRVNAQLRSEIERRKAAEKDSQASDHRLLAALEATNTCSWSVNLQTDEVDSMHGWAHRLGYDPNEITALRDWWKTIIHPDDVDIPRRALADYLEGRARNYECEYRVQAKSGQWLWTLDRGKVIDRDEAGTPIRMVGTDTDITERRQAEQAQRESEERLALALDATNEGLWDWNIATGELYYSPQWCQALGFDPSEVEPHGRFWQSLVHPEDMPRFKEALNAHFDGKTETYACEVRLRSKSGEYRWILDHGKVVARDENGKPLRMVGVDADISERKQTEEALRERTERYDLVAQGTCDAIWDWDVPNHSVYFSPRWLAMRGFAPGEVSDREEEWSSGIHPDDSARVMAAVQAHFKGETEFFQEEYRIRCKDGSYKWTLDRGIASRDDAGHVIRMAGSESDITERKAAEARTRELEAELAHASRVSTMGAAVSGLAHELNQPLSAVSTYASACKRMLGSGNDKQLVEILDKVAEQVDRAGRIIHRVQSFVRKEAPHRSTVDINELIREAVGFFETEVRLAEIAISLELSDSVPPLTADAIQIQQIIVNLVRNAFDAMNEIDAREHRLTIQSRVAGDNMVTIAVHDTGTGIDNDVAKRLFEPFFTTKSDGLGLGLSVSQSIIHTHGGRMWATPNPDRGATFHVTLPSNREPANGDC